MTYLTPPHSWPAVVVQSCKLEHIHTALKLQLMPQGHQVAEGCCLASSIPVHDQDRILPAASCHSQCFLIHQLHQVKDSGERRALLWPVTALHHHHLSGQVGALEKTLVGSLQTLHLYFIWVGLGKLQGNF